MKMKIKYTVLDEGCEPKLDPNDAGMDLRLREGVIIRAGEVVKVPLGIAFEIPQGYRVDIRERSSTFIEGIVTHHGLVDSSFNGKEVHALLFNMTDGFLAFSKGDRLVQAVGGEHSWWEEVKYIDDEGSKEGFGSSGRSE